MALIKWKQISGNLGTYGNLTGSFNVSGSINVNGQEVGTGKLDETTFNSYTSSNDTRVTSLEGFSSSLDATFATDAQLSSLSSSLATDITSLQGFSASLDATFATDAQLTSISSSLASSISSISTDFVDITNKPTLISSSAQIDLSQAIGTAPLALTASYAISASHEITYELSSSHAVQADSASFIADSFISSSAARQGFSATTTTFNGNRIISQDQLPSMFSSSFNPGTSGSLVEFIEKIFYPNTAPSFTSNANVNIAEFLTSGSSIHTLTANDPEAQVITFSAQASYTDGFVKVASNGAVTLLTSSIVESFNTVDRGDSQLAHQVPVKATDSFGASINQTLYIDVTANSAPVFRETSVGGNTITSFTAARNENASTGEITKLYFTDANSDSITITSSSVPGGHFSITKYGTYVSIAQATGSLDFETTSSYSFSISASDEHFIAGQDTDAIATLPITINVTDNNVPTFNNQTVTGFSEDENDGDSTKQLSATDPEGDTIVFTNFTLAGLVLDGTPVSIGTYTGVSQADPDEDSFQMSSTGAVTRKGSQFINSDLINSYIYSASVSDVFNTTSASAAITISIADDVAPSLGGIVAFYGIESAVDGDAVFDNSDGFSGTTSQFTSNQSVTWTVNPSSDFAVDSSGNLTFNRDISGSSDVGGGTLNGSVTGSNTFSTTVQNTFTVNITNNVGPSVSTQAQSSNLNTNGARVGNYVYQFTFSDTESDSIDTGSLTWTSTAALSASWVNDTTLRIFPTASIEAGTYNFTGSVKDDQGFETSLFADPFTISQAPIGSLTTNGSFYIIESAESGAQIKTNSNGRTGTQGDLGVSYSPTYNSAAVASFTSSNASIAVNSSGNLTIGVNISGSATTSGDSITSDITFRDQYDNIGSGSITVNVAANQAPTAVFSNYTANLTASIMPNTRLVDITISDSESDTPFSMSISGDIGNLKAVPQNADSSSYQIQNINRIYTGSTYNYTASIFDNFDETRSYNESFETRDQLGTTYFYGWKNTSPSSEATFLAGATGNVSGTPITSGSLIAMLQSGSIGASSFTPSTVPLKVSLFKSGALENLSSSNGISSIGSINFSQTGSILMVVFPSQSLLANKPGAMYDGSLPTGVDEVNQYYLYQDNTVGIDGVSNSGIYYFDTEDYVEGHKRWGMIYQEQYNSSAATYHLIADEQTYS
jgi:hypothetical protein